MGFDLRDIDESITLDTYKKGNIVVLTSNGKPIGHLLETTPELEKTIETLNKADIRIRTLKEREALNKKEYDALNEKIKELEQIVRLHEADE